ncbi:MAG: 50S ribosomal protein L4 [Candidatus Diapherotrites archaeon]|nr:50S ribosomal protein L4 [Candidatus Diapherotrites archaeon]
MKAEVLSLSGSKTSSVDLPQQFSEPLRSDVIQRAVLSAQSKRIQPKGNMPLAGRLNTAFFQGRRRKYSGGGAGNAKGHARLPRLKNLRKGFLGRVASVTQAVGGPRAHGPMVNQIRAERINLKEKRLAIRSAIAATTDKDLVVKRGHQFNSSLKFPVIVEDSFETVGKTKDAQKVFESLGIWNDVVKAKDKKKVRAGRGKTRGRKYKRRKGPLVVVSNKSSVVNALINMEGVDVVSVNNLNAEVLAPGCDAGRLTLWTAGAVKKLGDEKLFQ